MTTAQRQLIHPREHTSGPHPTRVLGHLRTPRFWACAVAVLVLSGLAAHAQPPESQVDIASLVQSVRAGNEQLGQAARAGTALPGANLTRIAEDRKNAMLSLMEHAPALALQNAFPPADWAQLPADIRASIERPVTNLVARLEVLGVLFDQGNDRTGLQLNLYSGNDVAHLFVDTIPDDYVTGLHVVVNGFQLEDRIAASHDNITITGEGAAPTSLSSVDVSRTALVININFSDNPAQPYTPDFAQNTVYNGQVTPWYADVSYGQLDFRADVTPWYTIAASSSTCATNSFRDQAVAAATADGYNTSQYNHIVMSFPRVAACGFAGLAQVGQVGGRGPYYAWLNNAMNLRVSVHELGHNLGLRHSHSLLCYDRPLSSDVSTCTFSEYGDVFDVMGTSTASYHGAYKVYLQWIPDTDEITVTPDDQAVQVTLNSVETPGGPRVLRVARPDTSPQEYFFVEMREPVGVDQVLGQYPYLSTGVAVYVGSISNQSIIRMQQTTGAQAPLQLGDTFSDPNSTLTITVLDVGNGQATISVSYNLSEVQIRSP